MNLPKFIITTSKSVFLYHNGLNEISKGRGVYFGVTQYVNGCIVLARNNFDGTGGGNTKGTNSLEFFDKDFNYKGHTDVPFVIDGHQILAVGNDLYITNSGLNIVSKINIDGTVEPIRLYTEMGRDIHHINSINFYNGEWYITQHRRNYGMNDGGIAIFTKHWSFNQYIDIGKHPHNVVIKDGFIWSTDSFNGKLVKINLNDHNDRTIYEINSRLLTRGLIVTDQYILVGLSQHDIREKRHDAHDAYIYVYDRSMKFIENIILSNVGQLNDLLLC